MSPLEVMIERLQPLRIATVTVNSQTPEGEAIDLLLDWARPRGLLEGNYHLFGYDNCRPAPDHTYTTWLSVGSSVEASDPVSIKDFSGGLFAVTELEGVENITQQWKQLATWCQNHGYRFGPHPCLEEPLDLPGSRPLNHCRFKLYLSLAE